ncbi:HlyD family efflux transporter periplasmic adaptor subunit [Caenispirillum bisanense]|uniref:HlyD family secretion protein n=1 Tax=Caenispirillum bisanense TaxID=414052 RepID=A0A286GF16_9PROT|nr:HlyD family efflux transporter periplasmic adaptor subunit [Caenispirillum bisanense]SOD93604.1 HlyD family secretion protein [Caenispirillum bisanense]
MPGRGTKAALAAVAVVVAAGIGVAVWRAPAATEAALYGTVEVRQVDVAFTVEGRLAEVLVEEGDAVRAGEPVARMERGYFEDALAIASARVAAQEQVLAKLEAGSRPQEVAAAEAERAAAEAQLVNARAEFTRQEDLVRTRAAAQRSLDDARAALDVARNRAAAAEERLSLLREGARAEDVAAARAQLEGERALRDLAQRRLSDTELTAPADGVVMSRVREPGSVLAPGATVVSLAKTAPVWVRAFVPEPRLGAVQPGSRAQVFTDSRPDQPYHGTIGYVAPVAEFTPKTVQTEELRSDLVFRFHVVIDGPDPLLRQGMPVTVVLE